MNKEEFVEKHGEEALSFVNPNMNAFMQKHFSAVVADATEYDIIDHDVIGRVLGLIGFKNSSLLEAKKFIQKHVPKEFLK